MDKCEAHDDKWEKEMKGKALVSSHLLVNIYSPPTRKEIRTRSPCCPSAGFWGGKEPIAGVRQQLRHPDRTNPYEKSPLERFFPPPGLPPSCRAAVDEAGRVAHRHHAEPNQQPHVFNLLLHERLVQNKAASSGDHSLKRLFI